MKIAVYTLTRDRADYTERMVQSLNQFSGYSYDHYIVDNGSTDGTVNWIKNHSESFEQIFFNPVNYGIGIASNQALDMIKLSGVEYDLIVKMDNDCEIVTPNLFALMVEIFEVCGNMLLSPKVTGITNQPKREYDLFIKTNYKRKYKIGRTGIVGGICHWMRAEIYQQYRYPMLLSRAKGQDDDFCDWAYKQSIPIGYVEDLLVNHMDSTAGQVEKYPEYFHRKWEEEKE